MMINRILKSRILLCCMLTVCIVMGCIGCHTPEPEPEQRYTGDSYGLGAFRSIDSLSALKVGILSEQQSSYDRDGGNVDALGMTLPDGTNNSGEYDGEESAIKRVLLDLRSPGVIYRMWFTNFGEVPNLRIYIDGEEKASVNMALTDIASGKNAPFLSPFVQNKDESSGGFVCNLPIVFSESVLVIGSGNFYYDISYHVHPSDSGLTPFRKDMDVSQAAAILSKLGTDPKYKSDNTYDAHAFDLIGSQAFELTGARSISSLELKLPEITPATYDRTILTEKGVKLSENATVSFKMATQNATVLTGRFLIQNFQQRLALYAGSNRIGEINVRARRFDGFEWKDNEYFEDVTFSLPSVVTQSADTTFKLVASTNVSIFHVWTKTGTTTVDDYTVGANSHAYAKTGTVSDTLVSAEYDPNTRFSESQQQKIYADEDILNDVHIRITYDGRETASVDAPVSAFFGVGHFGPYTNQMLMSGLKDDGTMYIYYPMPFEKSCKIELINRSGSALNGATLTIGHQAFTEDISNHGYFSTQYREYINGTPSALRNGEYFTILEASGSGHMAGVVLSMTGNYFGEHSRFYLEGDEVVYIDGSRSHSIHGTGTEDFFNGGWYFNSGARVNALYGYPVHNYRNNTDRSVMIRSLVSDPIVYRNGISFIMEHGGSNNRADSNVYVLAYHYHNATHAIQKTDALKLSDSESKTAHGYTADAVETKTLQTTYEAKYRQVSSDKMYDYVSGESEFTVKLNANNNGAMLRRLLTAEVLEQSAVVYVDGARVGIWNLRFRAAGFSYGRWDDFVIPASFTAGKTDITIRLENQTKGQSKIIPFTQSEFEVYSFV